jgi:hypothetical protein
MYEVDLVDVDGVIVSVAAAEPNFWNADSSQAAAWAAAAGYSLDVKAAPPASPERNLYVFADFQSWLQAQNNVGLARKTPGAPATQPAWVILGVLGIAGALYAVARALR